MTGPEATIYDGDGKRVYAGPVSVTQVDIGGAVYVRVFDANDDLRVSLAVPQTVRLLADRTVTRYYRADEAQETT